MPALSSYLILAILALTIALPFLKGEIKRHTGTVLLIACTVSVVLYFSQVLKGSGHTQKIQAQVEAQRFDTGLKFMSLVNVGTGKVSEIFGPIFDNDGKKHNVMELSNAGMGSTFKKAFASLQECVKSNPDNTVYKGKLAVLLSVWGQHKDLLKTTCNEMRLSKTASEQLLGDALWHSFFPMELDSKNFKKDLDAIESGLPKGWFQENAELALYKAYKSGYEQFLKGMEQRYTLTVQFGTAFLLLGALSTFVGMVVILIQLGSLGRRDSSDLDTPPTPAWNLSLRTIYAVFVGWITSQVAIGQLFKLLPKGMFSMGGDPLGIAAFSFLTYLIEMIPAFALIYFLAIRPQGLNPLNALCLRWKTRGFGPAKLLFSGYLGWCAIIPLVMLGAVIANLVFGSQGSDNPILAQIAIVVGSKNFLAIGILLFTVAVMAPICEEIIFRGFLYAGLKTKIGIFPAILLSSIIFAGIHMDPGGAPMLMALGPVLALALERTKSLFPSMIAHGLWNGGAFAVTLALCLG